MKTPLIAAFLFLFAPQAFCGPTTKFNSEGGGVKCPTKDVKPSSTPITESSKYFGKPYASDPKNIRWKEGESFDCTTFLTKVLQDSGYHLPKTGVQMINVSFLGSQEEMEKAVQDNSPAAAGVVWYMLDTKQGTEVRDVSEMKRGDLVQFWYRSKGRLVGHAGIVENVLPDQRVSLVGAHGTYKGGGSVGTKTYSLNKGDKNESGTIEAIYAVRPLAP